MGRKPVERGREAERLLRGDSVERGHVGEHGMAEGDRARLVEQHGPRLAEALDRPGALHHDPGPGGA
jgi:hypothetical protein